MTDWSYWQEWISATQLRKDTEEVEELDRRCSAVVDLGVAKLRSTGVR